MSRRADIRDMYPLSPLQQGLLAESVGGGTTYQQQRVCTLHGELDGDLLEAAWQRLVDRHPVLRTGFIWKQRREPFQVVFGHATLALERHDWRHLEPAEAARRLAGLADEQRNHPFDLQRPPLMRLALVRLEDSEHRLLWTYHHLLLDGWCVGPLLDELGALYSALASGGEPRLPARRPYADFVAWLRSRDAAAAERFWRRELEGADVPTPLGIDAAPRKEGVAGAVRRVLAPELSDAVVALARRERVTVASVVRGAWARLLSLYSGRRDVVFGATVAGRPPGLAGAESMIGPFINTVAVRVDVDPRAGVGEWLRRLRDRQVESADHEHASLVEVQGWAGLPRGRHLFDSLLLFQNYARAGGADAAGSGSGGAGLAVGGVESRESTHYPLTLVAADDPSVSLKVAYDGRRVGAAEAEMVLNHLEELLAAFADAGDRPVGALAPGARAGRAEAAPPLPAATVDRLVARTAAANPDAVAAAYPDGHLSYGELERRVGRLAGHLRRHGAGPDSVVAVALGRGVGLPVALLAVMRAGAAYLPLDPAYPADRLRWMLDDAAPRLLLTDRRHAGRLPEHGVETLLLDEGLSGGGHRDEAGWTVPAADSVAQPDGLAYVIYTSGSTGRPKGTQVAHRGVARHAVELGRLYRLGPGSRILHFFSPSFDASVEDLFPALAAGATVVGVGDPARLAAGELAAAAEERALTHLHLPASQWQRLGEALAPAAPGGRLPALRVVSFGGEAASGEALRRWHRATAGRTLALDVYGPTETTVTSAVCVLEPDEQAMADGPLPIGRAVAGSHCRVVDRRLRPLPAGVAGELVIGGEGVARGYLGRPAATAERFLPDPFAASPGGRLYRTGDRARRLADGRLAFHGRVDRQLKLRGFRVEPGEVEAALETLPEVTRAAVGGHGGRLAAWVEGTGDGGQAPDPAHLRLVLARTLPAHMVPEVWQVMERLPLNANGKVDHDALPPPEPAGPVAEAAPTSGLADPAEEVLAAIWGRLLGAGAGVGRDSDFFELGGHSILAVQAVARINEAFDVELPLRELFEHPTPGALAERVRGHQRGGGAPPPLAAGSLDRPRRLSFAQQRLWFLDQLEPGSTAYVVAKGVYLEGPLSVPALEAALAEVVRRHAVLRTAFPAVDGDPVQVVGEAASPRPPRRADLAGLDEAAAEAAVRHAVDALARRPFDLATGPLLRLGLLRLGERRHALVLALHHAVADGRSMEILLSELSRLYTAFAAGRPSPLAEPPVQYADYAEWQRQWLSGDVLAEHLDYWRRRLGGDLPVLRLGPQRLPGVAPGDRGGSHAAALPAELADGVARLSRDAGVTRFMTLLAAFQALLYRLSGETDVLVGADVAGRTRRETEGLVGFFVNMLVLRTELAGGLTFAALLERVREVALGAYAHGELPFERLVEEVQPERDGSHSPIFQVVFNYETVDGADGGGDGPDGDGLRLRPVPAGERPVRFDLTLGVADADGALRASWMYRRDLFSAADVELLHRRFVRLLAGAVADPGRDLDSLDFAAAEELEARRRAEGERRRSARSRLLQARPRAVPVAAGGGDHDESPIPQDDDDTVRSDAHGTENHS